MKEPQGDTIDALLRQQFEGPVADDGFSEKVMQHLPPRRPRKVWPMWLGVWLGAAACWICLINVPLLHVGWRDWLAEEPSTSAIGMLLAIAAMTLLTMGWGLLESRNR
jgi:hypothetical protein